jgi:hypothetical protein
VESRHHLVEQLREMTRDQQQMIAEQTVPALLVVLSRKGEVLETLQAIHREMSPYQGQAPEDRLWRCEGDRQRCRDLLSQTETILTELLAMEQTALGELSQRRDIVASQLNHYTTAETIHGAYATVMEPEVEPSLSMTWKG